MSVPPADQADACSSSIAASPILRGCSPADYLQPFRSPCSAESPQFTGMGAFCRHASLDSNSIRTLDDYAFAVIQAMHESKRRKAEEFSKLPQDILISVIMPTKNRGAVIGSAIQSVLVQTYSNWELIVVNDGGDNEVEGILAAFADERIRYVCLPETGGAGQARNKGNSLCSGDYVAYLDDDDQWDPDFLLIALNELRSKGRRFAYSAQIVWRGFDESTCLGVGFIHLVFSPFNRSSLENSNYISMIACMHERSLFSDVAGFDTGLKRGIDWDFFIRLTEVTEPLAIPCILSHYFSERAQTFVSMRGSYRLMAHNIYTLQRSRASWLESLEDDSPARKVTVFGLSERQISWRADNYPLEICPKAAVFILSYGSVKHARRCIESMRKHTPGLSLLYVLHACADEAESAAFAALEKEYPGVRTLSCGASFADAHGPAFWDVVLQSAKGCDAAIMALDEAIVSPRWLEELAYVLQRFPDAGMAVSRKVLPAYSLLIQCLAPRLNANFEADLALHSSVIEEPDVEHEGYYALQRTPLFCAMFPITVLRELRDSGQHVPLDSSEFSAVVRAVTRKKIYYTPFSKVYCIKR